MNSQTSRLLPDHDGEPPRSLVLTLAEGKPTSREHRQFLRLVAELELKREQLESWQAYVHRYNQRINGELEPLQAQLWSGQKQMVALIDELLTRPGKRHRLGSAQRSKLLALLFNLLEGLLQHSPDADLEVIHNRYSDVPHEQSRQDSQNTQSPEAQAQEQPHASAERKRAGGGAKAQARQAQREEAAKEVRQSMRQVFRKLVSALHPDREPDEQARLRKTQLMQRVNRAYEARDLLTLLTLQLEVEQVSVASLAAASRERLMHYNQILREQLIELDQELEDCVAPFRQSLEAPRGRSLTIADVDRGLGAACARLSRIIRGLQAEMAVFRDPVSLRERLRHFELEPELDELDGADELADMAELMRAFQEPSGRSRRRRRRPS